MKLFEYEEQMQELAFSIYENGWDEALKDAEELPDGFSLSYQEYLAAAEKMQELVDDFLRSQPSFAKLAETRREAYWGQG